MTLWPTSCKRSPISLPSCGHAASVIYKAFSVPARSRETDALGTRLDIYDPHLLFRIHPTMIRITDTNDTALKEKKIFISETITMTRISSFSLILPRLKPKSNVKHHMLNPMFRSKICCSCLLPLGSAHVKFVI